MRSEICVLLRASKRRMQNVANVSILAMFSMYLLTAIFGYLTFYGKGQLLSGGTIGGAT